MQCQFKHTCNANLTTHCPNANGQAWSIWANIWSCCTNIEYTIVIIKQTRVYIVLILLAILYYRSMFSCAWPAISVLLIPHLCHGITVTVDRRDEGLPTVPQDVTTNVTHFILISNSITHIDFNSFEYYTALIKIDLSQNPLKIIANGTFENNHQLSIMKCLKGAIESAPASFGPCTQKISMIDFRQGVTNTDVLLNFDFVKFRRLRTLNLDGVALPDLNVLPLPLSIRVISVIHAEISTLPQVDRTRFPELSWLWLGSNKLSLEIPYSWFENMSANIMGIVLRNNYIAKLPEAIPVKIRLHYFNLANNHLLTIPDMLDFPDLRQLFIGDNPVTCDRGMCWWRLWDRMRAPLFLKDDIECKRPPLLRVTMLSNVNPKAMGCYNGKWAINEAFTCLWQWSVFVINLQHNRGWFDSEIAKYAHSAAWYRWPYVKLCCG